jgi:hypothetical protein
MEFCLKRMRLSPVMPIPQFEAQGTRRKAHGKSNIEIKLPCASNAETAIPVSPYISDYPAGEVPQAHNY